MSEHDETGIEQDEDVELTPQERQMRRIFGRDWQQYMLRKDSERLQEDGRKLRVDTHELVREQERARGQDE